METSVDLIFHLPQPPQKTRRGETGQDEKEDAEITARNKQEMYSRPPPLQKKSIVPSTVSRKVIRTNPY